MSVEDDRNITRWSDSTEKLLQSWADSSLCFRLLHEEAFRKFKKINMAFNIPVIILSTLTGSTSLASNALFPGMDQAPIFIGIVSLLTGIIQTISSYFKYESLATSHYSAFKSYSRLHRDILVELSLPRQSRKPVEDFLKQSITTYNNLVDTSPIIPKAVMKKLDHELKKIEDLFNPLDLKHTTVNIKNTDSPSPSEAGSPSGVINPFQEKWNKLLRRSINQDVAVNTDVADIV